MVDMEKNSFDKSKSIKKLINIHKSIYNCNGKG